MSNLTKAVDSINGKWHSATEGMSLDDEQRVLEDVKNDIEVRLEEIEAQQNESDE